MSADTVITPAAAVDMDAVMTVMVEAFDPAFGEAWNVGQCLGILSFPGVQLLLARRSGVVAGFALSRVIVDEAELLLLGVRPAWRRHGVGADLLDRVRLDAASRGARTMHLEVRDGNPALHLYQARGMVQTGRRPAYYRGSDGRLYDAISLSVGLAEIA